MFRALSMAVVLVALAGPAAAQAEWEGARAAFFGVTFLDTSHEGELNPPRADEAARLALVEAYLVEAFEARGIELVDLAPVADDLALIVNPAECYGCDLRMAERLGARYAIVSEVQKVSNLILAMNVVVKEVATGAQVRALAVDIRGNTDDSWLRGMRYIVERGIFKE
jgi:hypothetical protein